MSALSLRAIIFLHFIFFFATEYVHTSSTYSKDDSHEIIRFHNAATSEETYIHLRPNSKRCLMKVA